MSEEKVILDLTPKIEQKEETIRKPRIGAEAVALEMGLIKQEQVIGDPQKIQGFQLGPTIRGRKALVGQYIKEVKTYHFKPTGEIDSSKPVTVQRIDMSEVINASVKGAIKLPVRKAE